MSIISFPPALRRPAPGMVILVLCFFSGLSSNAQKTRKAVFVIADGIPADMIESLKPPHLQEIIRQGVYHRLHVGGIKGSYNETPTISAPGYNDLLTGTWGNKHNVLDNNISAPNYHYQTLFRFFKEAFPLRKTAIFSSWQDNRTRLVGDRLKATGNFAVDIKADGFELDTVAFAHDRNREFMHTIDEKVVAAADSVLRAQGPDLSWVYLEYTDDMGHKYGTGSPEYTRAIGYLDGQMGKLKAAIDYREKTFNEEWLLIITTDHGRDPNTGRNHGGQSDRERTTWVVSNLPGENDYFGAAEPAIVDILPSVATFLNVPVPDANRFELDGVSWFGPVSVSDGRAFVKGDSLSVQWKAYDALPVKILVSTANYFKTGSPDSYQTFATVDNRVQQVSLPLTALPASSFYKVVIDGSSNAVNWWISR